MSMSPNHLFMRNMDRHITPEYIAQIFERNKIAQVSHIVLIPYVKVIGNYIKHVQKAYITIGGWYDTESAYNFIQRLKDPTKEARLVYHLDNWWAVYLWSKPFPQLLALDLKIDEHMQTNMKNVTLRTHQRRMINSY